MKRSFTRLMLAAGFVSVALAASAAPALAQHAPAGPTRFHVVTVGDSTFTFATAETRWVKKGVKGTAVDPKRRDAVVAQFEVISVENGTATALVTAQTSSVTTQHEVLIDTPSPRSWGLGGGWGAFGAGAIGGAIAGAIVASIMGH